MTESDIRYDDAGSRILGELNTGLWWERTSKAEFLPEVSQATDIKESVGNYRY